MTQDEIDKLFAESERLHVLDYQEEYRVARKKYLQAQAEWYEQEHQKQQESE